MAQIKDQPVALGDRPVIKRIRRQQRKQCVSSIASFGYPGEQRWLIRKSRARSCHRSPQGQELPFYASNKSKGKGFRLPAIGCAGPAEESHYFGRQKNCSTLRNALPRWLYTFFF